MHIRANDTVLVLCGGDKGARARVLRIDRAAGKVVVEGVNKVTKLVRRSQKNPQGGMLSKEMPIQLSNVMLVCPTCNQAARIGARRTADGAKERYCKKCGAGIGQIAPSKSSKAAQK
jgi:large subunit ribosomal protein L24